ncbi:phosphate propanoyltransferase [Candidatus Caldatribacterium sp. SIUC1]|uniref:phosphate propanoyltransferase n=1 Tax=Candidatus Caldatribacterium sp. SIUC1 TaxID=3418365 RepID=UPI003F692FD4
MERLDDLVAYIAEIVVQELQGTPGAPGGECTIPVEVSNRHCHLTRETFEVLYGKGKELTLLRELSQRGEFAAQETVTLVGPNMRSIEGVRILGPFRKFDQVELSFTDGFYLGMDLPVRLSGDVAGSAPITIVGPKGSVTLKEGAIRAMRHLHASPEEAKRLGLRDGEKIAIEVPGPIGVVFQNVTVRVSPNGRLAFHIDTDEANAAGVKRRGLGRIVRG